MKISLRSFAFNKTWIVLGVALGIGLLAAIGARSYLSGQMAAIEARSKGTQVAAFPGRLDLNGEVEAILRTPEDQLFGPTVFHERASEILAKPFGHVSCTTVTGNKALNAHGHAVGGELFTDREGVHMRGNRDDWPRIPSMCTCGAP